MAETDTLYTYAIIGGLVIASVYYGLRLRIESRKEQASRASLEAMVKYHSQRLEIEQEKLEIARGNVSTQGVHVREHSRRNPNPVLEAERVDPPEPMMSDEEFAAAVKRIREMG